MKQNAARLKFGVIGAGFWTPFQLSGWQELGMADCVCICNRTLSKSAEIAGRFNIPNVYEDAEQMLARGDLAFVDVITGVETHPNLVELAAAFGVPVICQKPMANSLAQAESMVQICAEAGVAFLINENWRWQAPIRALKHILDSAEIGAPFRARITLISGFPVFENQPFLKTLDQFILTDLGSHLLDVARFLFGEAKSLYCHTNRVHADIAGEDVATVLLRMNSGVSVSVEMAYAGNFIEDDRFPETHIFVEGSRGSIELKHDFQIHITTKAGTRRQQVLPPHYSWADPRYDIVHSSIVPCQANLLRGLLGQEPAETSAGDNIKTVRLVFAAYESARTGAAIHLS